MISIPPIPQSNSLVLSPNWKPTACYGPAFFYVHILRRLTRISFIVFLPLSSSAPTHWTCWPHRPVNQVRDLVSPSCPLVPVPQCAQSCSRRHAVACLALLPLLPVEFIDSVEGPLSSFLGLLQPHPSSLSLFLLVSTQYLGIRSI